MNWFWNNPLMTFIENVLVNITNKLWKKRREAEKKALEKNKK